MYFKPSARIAQGAAALILAGSLIAGAAWPGADAAELPAEPEAVGVLVIPARLTAEEREIWRHVCQMDNERQLALKLARTEAAKAEAVQEPEADPAEIVEAEPYTERELELLAITIYSEAGSDTISDDTRRMVGEVVLNRVADERYPDTIEAVLTQRGQYGRFHWTGVVWPSRASRSVEAHAVTRAYDCARTVFEGERLLPTDTIYQAGFRQGRECVAHAPGFYFCR